MIVNDSDNDIDTFWLSETDFDTVEAYTSQSDTITANISVPATDDKYTGLTVFYISPAGNYENWKGYKAQPWPDAGWTEMFRFEKGDSATGSIVYYDDWSDDINASNTAMDDDSPFKQEMWRWEYKTKTLESAFIGLETAAASAVTLFASLMLM